MKRRVSKKQKKTKDDLRKHFKKRWHQRVDHECEPPLRRMIQVIRDSDNGYLIFFQKQSNTRTKWKFKWKEREYLAIYDKTKRMFVTVFPLDWEISGIGVED